MNMDIVKHSGVMEVRRPAGEKTETLRRNGQGSTREGRQNGRYLSRSAAGYLYVVHIMTADSF